MIIAFHEEYLGIRGTSVAMYDYANYNEKILGNKSIIITRNIDSVSSILNLVITKTKIFTETEKVDPLGVSKFESRFPVFRYKTQQDLEKIIEDEKCNVLYSIKYGKRTGILSTKIKNVIHCVFDMSQPHGNVYAGVSEALASKFNSKIFVPHMIGLEPSTTYENMRRELDIPKDAIVFGRYGGLDTMDLKFCWLVISQIVSTLPNIYLQIHLRL